MLSNSNNNNLLIKDLVVLIEDIMVPKTVGQALNIQATILSNRIHKIIIKEVIRT